MENIYEFGNLSLLTDSPVYRPPELKISAKAEGNESVKKGMNISYNNEDGRQVKGIITKIIRRNGNIYVTASNLKLGDV